MEQQVVHIFSTRVAHVAEDVVKHNSFGDLKKQLTKAAQQQPVETFERSTVFVKAGKKMGSFKAFTSAFRLKMNIKFANTPILKHIFKLSKQEAPGLEKNLKETAQAAARKKYGIPENLKPVNIDDLPNIDEGQFLSVMSRNPHAAYYNPQQALSKEHYQVYKSITEILTGKEFSEETMNAYFKALAKKNPEGLRSEFRSLYEAHGKLLSIAENQLNAMIKNSQWYLDNSEKILEKKIWCIKTDSSLKEAAKTEKIKKVTKEAKKSVSEVKDFHQKITIKKTKLHNIRTGKIDATPEQFNELLESYMHVLYSLTNRELMQDEAAPLLREALEAAKPKASAG